MPDPSRNAELPVYLFGGSGAVGGFLLQRLRAASRPVIAYSRAPPADAGPAIRWCHGTLADFTPPPVRCQIVSAGPLDALAERLTDAPPAAGSAIVALSSMSLVWKREARQPAERRVAERLRQAEDRLQRLAVEHDLRLQLLRPTLIWGAGRDRSLTPLVGFARRWRCLPWPRWGRGLRQPVHADDVAAALLAALGRDGPALSLPGAETLPFTDLLRRALAAGAPSARLLPLPLPRALLQRLAARDDAVGRVAAPFARSADDQLADAGGWRALALTPRSFAPDADAFLHR